MADTPQSLITEAEREKASRSNFDDLWQEIGDYIDPRRADFTTVRSPGERRRRLIFDNTGEQALNKFASGLHNNLTSKGLPWFYLETRDKRLNSLREVKLWLADTSRRMYDVFNSPETTFHSRAHEMEKDLGAFGNGCMFIGDAPGRGPYFTTHFLGECYPSENERGVVDTMRRFYRRTARQIADEFPKAVPDIVARVLEKEPEKTFECLHIVKPRRAEDRTAGRRDRANLPFASYYIFLEGKSFLDIGGFHEFPYIFTRWEQNSGEKYGRGPGGVALPDVKLLNVMEKTILTGLQKMVDPPMQMPSDGYLGRLRLAPGQVTYYRRGLAQHERAEPLLTMGRPDLGDAKAASIKEQIRAAFYNDLFELPGPLAPDGDVQHMSATEVAARQRDRLSELGPILSRQEAEYLSKLIFRTLNIMVRNGMTAVPPRELERADLRVNYINPLSIAQRAPEVASIMQATGVLAPLAQQRPDVMDNFDFDKIADVVVDVLRVPPEVMLPFREVQRIRAERAKQAEAMRAAQQAQLEAGAAKDMSAAVGNATLAS